MHAGSPPILPPLTMQIMQTPCLPVTRAYHVNTRRLTDDCQKDVLDASLHTSVHSSSHDCSHRPHHVSARVRVPSPEEIGDLREQKAITNLSHCLYLAAFWITLVKPVLLLDDSMSSSPSAAAAALT